MLHLQLMCENERATPRVKANTDSPGQRHAVEVANHKTHGPVPAPGSVGIAKVTQVMAKIAFAGIMCIGQKSHRDSPRLNKQQMLQTHEPTPTANAIQTQTKHPRKRQRSHAVWSRRGSEQHIRKVIKENHRYPRHCRNKMPDQQQQPRHAYSQPVDTYIMGLATSIRERNDYGDQDKPAFPFVQLNVIRLFAELSAAVNKSELVDVILPPFHRKPRRGGRFSS
ncbi:hypothetical protein KIW84_010276 [Lathyrus oleraceus]|uniref:PI4-kinase N-terminal domain-containing protein n=1 Tax=Pisum sativum TaxID=3888 RepID=A0A9D5BDX5_PEA|nr:hypothetical protein KIW84_010274 [Pisum sativum]KAI5440741.1 hypothetical protein KIW84_010276 [Pisum sativum]